MNLKKQFTFSDGYVLDFLLDSGKRKNMYLTVRDGIVTLKVPETLSTDRATDFLISKEQWIKDNLSKAKPKAHGLKEYKDGEKILLLGKEYTLCFVYADKYFKAYFDDDKIKVSVKKDYPQDRIKSICDKLIDEFAVQKISRTTERLSKQTGLYPAEITVKNMKSSWGRCSSNGKISINREIIYYTQECLEYVIIHELCHLRHMNHSKEFWELVERFCPDRKRIRKQLNESI